MLRQSDPTNSIEMIFMFDIQRFGHSLTIAPIKYKATYHATSEKEAVEKKNVGRIV